MSGGEEVGGHVFELSGGALEGHREVEEGGALRISCR